MKVMSGLDARFLYSEAPTVHMHTMKVVVVDLSRRSEALKVDDLAGIVEGRLNRMPILRRRIIPVAKGFGNPVIVDDPEFNIANHLKLRTLDPPGDQRQLDNLIAEIAGIPLPRDRPLWTLTVVKGLWNDQMGFIMKLHHALADGVASVAMLENAFIADDDDAVTEAFRPEEWPARSELYRASAKGVARAVKAVPKVVRQTLRGLRESKAVREELDVPAARPFSGPLTPFNVSLTADRTFATLNLPIADVLRVKDAAGVKLNDAFLSLCGGATRRYLQRIGELPRRSLVTSVPMATRTDRYRLGGNHVDNLFIPLHTDLSDPVERVRRINASTVAARRTRQAFGPELFELRSGLVPAGFHGIAPRLWARTGLSNHTRPPLNLVASCVRGPAEPLEVAGGYVTSLFSCGPILEGIGLNITAWSYVDTLYVSILGCSASLPHPERLAADMRDELDDWTRRL